MSDTSSSNTMRLNCRTHPKHIASASFQHLVDKIVHNVFSAFLIDMRLSMKRQNLSNAFAQEHPW